MAGPSDRERRDRREDRLSGLAEAYRKAAPYTAASTQLVASVALLAALGYWLDRKLGHEKPWLFIVGAAVGMVVGFTSFFRTVLGPGKAKGK